VIPDDSLKLDATKSSLDVSAATAGNNDARTLRGQLRKQFPRMGTHGGSVRVCNDRRKCSVEVEGQKHVP